MNDFRPEYEPWLFETKTTTAPSRPDGDGPCENTDREIWRGPDEGGGDFYSDSLHITKEGALGINCGGMVYVKSIREWHRLASTNGAEGAGDIAQCVETIEESYAFADGNIPLTKCGERIYLKELVKGAPPQPAPGAMRALEPFIKAARIIAKRPQDYDDRIVMIGGLSEPADLRKQDFFDLEKVFSAPVPSPDGAGEATPAQHVGRIKGEPAKFVRNGKLETCQCLDCRTLSPSGSPDPGLDKFKQQVAGYVAGTWDGRLLPVRNIGVEKAAQRVLDDAYVDPAQKRIPMSAGAAEPGAINIANEIDAAFEKFLSATGAAEIIVAENTLRAALWENKAGIIAYLRRAAPPVRGDREAIAECLCDSRFGKGAWQHKRDSAKTHNLMWPVTTALEFYFAADAILSLPSAPVSGRDAAIEALEIWRKAEQARCDASAAYNSRLETIRAERQRDNWLMSIQPEFDALGDTQRTEVVKRRELFAALSNYKESES